MWDLLMKYLCPRDFRRGEMEEKMTEDYQSFEKSLFFNIRHDRKKLQH